MSWDDLHNEILAWTNLSQSRPFSKLSSKPIIDGALEGLHKEKPDLEAATLAVDELSVDIHGAELTLGVGQEHA